MKLILESKIISVNKYYELEIENDELSKWASHNMYAFRWKTYSAKLKTYAGESLRLLGESNMQTRHKLFESFARHS